MRFASNIQFTKGGPTHYSSGPDDRFANVHVDNTRPSSERHISFENKFTDRMLKFDDNPPAQTQMPKYVGHFKFFKRHPTYLGVNI